MNRKIEFKENELNELIQVLTLCQPEHGFLGDHLYRTIVVFFRKYYHGEIGFVTTPRDDFISSDKCFIKINEQEITVKQIMEELFELNLLDRKSVQVDATTGKPAVNNNVHPVKRTFYSVKK